MVCSAVSLVGWLHWLVAERFGLASSGVEYSTKPCPRDRPSSMGSQSDNDRLMHLADCGYINLRYAPYE